MSLQFRYNATVLKTNLSGVSNEQSLCSSEHGPNCLNWIVGHIVNSRDGFLQVLNQDLTWTNGEGKMYGQGADFDPTNPAFSLEELMALYSTAGKRIRDGLEAFDLARLSEPAPFGVGPGDPGTLAKLFPSLIWHETYHTGQTGVVRRTLGLEGAIK
ncbi:MAG: DinB family protein [Candidatus Eisenbacteria bacterium]|uniref:DinB family protein n=1 Tax=Eiseniibacteriota bacterium TaxID=2212470 RepID=A0A7Y2E773_UNCEI|nr:DinB family protein [Candidatus Eisenbacteria bacterium]